MKTSTIERSVELSTETRDGQLRFEFKPLESGMCVIRTVGTGIRPAARIVAEFPAGDRAAWDEFLRADAYKHSHFSFIENVRKTGWRILD